MAKATATPTFKQGQDGKWRAKSLEKVNGEETIVSWVSREEPEDGWSWELVMLNETPYMLPEGKKKTVKISKKSVSFEASEEELTSMFE